MTDKTQPEALRLADELAQRWGANMACQELDAAAELRRQHARIVELEAQLDAVGAALSACTPPAPAGWKLVPVEPTKEMVAAACREHGYPGGSRAAYVHGYKSMIAASPTPPAEQAAPKAAPGEPYKDSTPHLSVGDSSFESWYSSYCPAHKADKQRARDAYAAGMGDPLVRAAPQQEAQEPATVPYQKLTDEIDLILSDPDTELSIGAKRALLWMRTWVSVPLFTAPQQEAQEPYGYVFAEQYAPTVGSELKTTREVFTRVKPDRQCLALYTAPQPTQAQAGAVPLDEARRLFDAGWKAAALFCDREDVVADGIIGFGACPQFEAAFSAAHGITQKGGNDAQAR